MTLTRRQLVLLIILTLVWGLNWPVMKIGVSAYPPFAFRALCMWLGLPVMALAVLAFRQSFVVPRAHWHELFWLAVTNMFFWQSLMMLALAQLSSGRAAILAYSTPIFSAILSVMFFRERLSLRQVIGVAAAMLGVMFLLWHEVSAMSGRPWGVLLALVAAASWSLGVRQMRTTRIPTSTLALAFWMTAMTAVVLSVLSALFEGTTWTAPNASVWAALAYNAMLVFGFATAMQLHLARTLSPVATSLSVMMIPILGVFSGAVWLYEVLHWQDWAAVVLMVMAIGSVLLPARAAATKPA